MNHLFEWAEAATKKGDHQHAVDLLTRLVENEPLNPIYLFHLGTALIRLQRSSDGAKALEKSIGLDNTNPKAHINLGAVYLQMGFYRRSLLATEQALALDSKNPRALYNRGAVFHEMRKFDQAILDFDRSLSVEEDAHTYYGRAKSLYVLGRYREAMADLNRTIGMNPAFAEAYFLRANVFQEFHQSRQACENFDIAFALMVPEAPMECIYNKAFALLAAGDFSNGWPLYEWRWMHKNFTTKPRAFSKPQWNGESLKEKRLFLYSEQGFGDVIQFSRYAVLAAFTGGEVILEAHPKLVPLLRTLDGVRVESDFSEDFDYHSPLMSLPRVFKTELETIPQLLNYLEPDPDRVKKFTDLVVREDPNRFRVGVSWSGNEGHASDAKRSIRFAQFIEHLPKGPLYVSLQKEVREKDEKALRDSEVLDLSEHLDDFADTAALCELMDLVICVDTSVAHLSAAIGKETWVLISYTPDWRWMFDRNDSPWYPTMKLFRQSTHGDWDGVLRRISTDLNGLLTERKNGR